MLPRCIDASGTWNQANIRNFLDELVEAHVNSLTGQLGAYKKWLAGREALDHKRKRAQEDHEIQLKRCDAAYSECEGEHCYAGWVKCKKRADDTYETELKKIDRAVEALNDAYSAIAEAQVGVRARALKKMKAAWRSGGNRLCAIVQSCEGSSGVSDAPCLGRPTEMIPDRVYIAPPIVGERASDGFIAQAVKFHRNDWKLPVTNIDSLEAIIGSLASSKAKTIDRVRIVTHGQPHSLDLAMFSGTADKIDAESLDALI